eukprot:m.150040 g.150040  ORF g.150040 m.150040 type:complete len:930 (-) comp14220_c0_seq1:47-2836(-)
MSGQEDFVSAAEAAVNVLYNSHDPQARQEAQAWLSEQNNSPEAWQYAWELMQPGRMAEARHYGANLLTQKINRRWDELDSDTKASMSQPLLELLSSEVADIVVFNKLSQALCILMFKAAPDHWPNPAEDIVTAFQSISTEENPNLGALVLVRFAKILGEEYDRCNKSLAVKARLQNTLIELKSMVIRYTLEFLQAEDTAMLVLSLETATVWVALLPDWDETVQLFDPVLPLLQNPETAVAASDLAVAMLYLPTASKMTNTLQQLADAVSTSGEAARNAVEQGEFEVCKALASLGSAIGQIFIKPTIMRGPTAAQNQSILAFLEFMVELISLPGTPGREDVYTVSTLPFWNDLVDSIADSELPILEAAKEEYGDALLRFVRVLCIKVQYPPDDDPLDSDEMEEMRVFRSQCGEVVSYLSTLYKEPCLVALYDCLTEAEATGSWQMVEGVVQMLGDAGTCLNYEQIQAQPIVEAVLKLNGQPLLEMACLSLFNEYSEFLATDSTSLFDVLTYIVERLSNPELCNVAAAAFAEVCHSCDALLAPEITNILQAADPVLADVSFPLKARRLTAKAVCSALIAIKNRDEMTQYATQLYVPLVAGFDECVQSQTEFARDMALAQLELLRVVTQYLDPLKLPKDAPHPLFPLVNELLPRLQSMLATNFSDYEIIEQVCLCFSGIARTIEHRFHPIASEVLRMVLDCFQMGACPHCLTCLGDIFREFHSDLDAQAQLHPLYAETCSSCFQLFETTFRENNEVTCAFFDMTQKVARTCPDIVFGNMDLVSNLFQWALAGIECPEPNVVKTACLVLTPMLGRCTRREDVAETIAPHLERFMTSAYQGICGGHVPSLVDYIAHVLFHFNRDFREQFKAMSSALLLNEESPLDLSNVPLIDRQVVLERLGRDAMRKSSFRSRLVELSKQARGLAKQNAIVLD